MLTPLIPKADLLEIFSSIQGEGVLVGTRQIFLRFPDCHLNCRYCDTDFLKTENCQVESVPGSGDMAPLENPVDFVKVKQLLESWNSELPSSHHSISITGGEPLLHKNILLTWLPELRKILPIYLETNGMLPDELEPLIQYIDWVSMDIKLHSQTGSRTEWDIHRQFLEIANQTDCYVKLVVGDNTPDLELQLAADLVSTISKYIPIVLQPVTVEGQVRVSTKRLLQMQALIADTNPNVRVIPQTHRFMGVL
ncbi:7-carboxy-7-deazaguanine synthase QueE [uncultured Desulfuromusa sp.]|uniref:7-carboxy-7-deazaguanine synthase QueE n=1 Tax=uncultured Desulfuromusa sp. TaxID=219183 RepID=UPI002AA877D9|nr:7-carboxy-7-deazaguanine synthase QueE [uncultured Desulfuromusa sp.]